MADKISYSNAHQLLQISGLASGMDTNSLIDGLMKLERIPIDRKLGEKQILEFQQNRLQEINLKIFNLKSKATDLTFSKAFNSKEVATTDSSRVGATATTGARTGSYRVVVNQVATKSTVQSRSGLSGNLHRGRYSESSDALNGLNLRAGDQAAGLTGIDFAITVNGVERTLDLSSLSTNSTLEEVVTTVNEKIAADSSLSGTVKLDYEAQNNNLRFLFLGSSQELTVKDKTGNFIDQFFSAGGQFDLDSAASVQTDRVALAAGTNQTLGQLGITAGSLDLDIGGGAQNIDLSSLTSASTVKDALDVINAGIADNAGLSGKVRAVFDDRSQKIRLELNNSFDTATTLQVSDAGGGDFVDRFFGAASVTAGIDAAAKLSTENFGLTLTSGTFTLDGVKLSVDVANDTLGDLLDRITNATSLNAGYDSLTDRVTLTRKDGTASAIGVGASTDTSNILSALGLANASQAGAAQLSSSANVGAVTATQAQTAELNSILGNFTNPLAATSSGILDVTVNGVTRQVAYNSQAGGDTLSDVLDRIAGVDGIASATYDSATGKVRVETEGRGATASLSISESAASGGNLAAALNLPGAAVYGQANGSSLTSKKPLSAVSPGVDITSAGFLATPTTGNFTLNGKTISVNDGDTLQRIIDRINGVSGIGVTASFDSASNSLKLTNNESGNTSFSLGAGTDTSNFLSATGLLSATQNIGQNTMYSIDGGATVTTKETLITDALEGVTLNLLAATDAQGETITVTANVEATKTAINDFITYYNELAVEIDKALTEKRDYTLIPLTSDEKSALSDDEVKTYEENLQKGLLANDSTLKNIQRRFRTEVFGLVDGLPGASNSLASIGLSSGVVGAPSSETRVGKIVIVDQAKFDAALENDVDAVKSLFAQDGSSKSSQGIARRIKELSSEFSDYDGILTTKAGRLGQYGTSEMDKQIVELASQIANKETQLTKKEDDLLARFARLEQAIQTINTQGNQLLASLSQKSG